MTKTIMSLNQNKTPRKLQPSPEKLYQLGQWCKQISWAQECYWEQIGKFLTVN